MMKRLLTVLTAGLVLMGCERDSLLGPSESNFEKDRAGSPVLNVVTYNVYYGAPIQELMMVPAEQIPLKAAELWGKVQATNFAERAEAIVDGIQAADAHLVALQEMTLFRSESPSDFDPMNPFPLPPPDAEDVELDYVDILMQVLDNRGLSYDVAWVTPTFDIEVPYVNFSTGGLDDLRLTEMLVILVRGDVDWTNAMGATYYAALPIEIGPQTIYKPSGWASVDITHKGLPYTFINTHLEPADMGGVLIPELMELQAYQLAELLMIAGSIENPVIMAGDFNSDADGSTTPTYQDVRDAGFLDAWLIGPQRGNGFTANQASDLLNVNSELFHRIDFIFYRDAFTQATGHFQGSVKGQLLGEEQGDRTPSGLWPSDHAGLAAALRIAPGKGHAE
jgi:endonuclease/exonuclease/phosphatase family metal-dependent hydrolase